MDKNETQEVAREEIRHYENIAAHNAAVVESVPAVETSQQPAPEEIGTCFR